MKHANINGLLNNFNHSLFSLMNWSEDPEELNGVKKDSRPIYEVLLRRAEKHGEVKINWLPEFSVSQEVPDEAAQVLRSYNSNLPEFAKNVRVEIACMQSMDTFVLPNGTARCVAVDQRGKTYERVLKLG